ncbi:nuclease-related domain-containing protein [Shouchella shacheensis]|uniref:nuclease-related domain-containing protein n=1 Tax=Shouchella shacheensis TaxID=1649580 RepID=UPI00074042A3|nr:nuclease-related domain-containing protein [Shouchella shacheensis]
MIQVKKSRGIPRNLLQLEALLARLPEAHPKREEIREELFKRRSGYRGERTLDFILTTMPPTERRWHTFHDIRLQQKRYAFQIDTLLLSIHCIVLMEVKNFSGEVHFDSGSYQFTRTNNKGVQRFSNPLFQVQRQQTQLEAWLDYHNFPPLPVISIVVFSSSHTIITTNQAAHAQAISVLHAEALPEKLREIESKFNKPWLSTNQASSLISLLLNNHQELSSNCLKRYQIHPADILTGVTCTACQRLKMQKSLKSKNWRCPHCGHHSKNAHIASLQDYALLIDPSISNSEARHFLEVDSQATARRMLTSLQLKVEGSYKNRRYLLPIPLPGAE